MLNNLNQDLTQENNYLFRHLINFNYKVSLGRHKGKTLWNIYQDDRTWFRFIYNQSKTDNNFPDKLIEYVNIIYTRT